MSTVRALGWLGAVALAAVCAASGCSSAAPAGSRVEGAPPDAEQGTPGPGGTATAGPQPSPARGASLTLGPSATSRWTVSESEPDTDDAGGVDAGAGVDADAAIDEPDAAVDADAAIDEPDAGADAGGGAVDAGADASVCLPPIPTDTGPCGQLGAVCCAGATCNDGSLACIKGRCAEACGHAGQPCCAGACLDAGGSCSGGMCQRNAAKVGGPGYAVPGIAGACPCGSGLVCSAPILNTYRLCVYPSPPTQVALSAQGCATSFDCGGGATNCEPISTTSAVKRCCITRLGACAGTSDCCGDSLCLGGLCQPVQGGRTCTGTGQCGTGVTCDACHHKCCMGNSMMPCGL